jgi:hypothetical protein
MKKIVRRSYIITFFDNNVLRRGEPRRADSLNPDYLQVKVDLDKVPERDKRRVQSLLDHLDEQGQ